MKYLFISTQRSGHHAVLVWFISQHHADYTHYNNCKILSDKLVTSNGKYCDCCNFNGSIVNQRHHELNKNRIVFNFENKPLQYVEMCEHMSPINIGTRKKIIVLRDHYNTIASYIKNWSIKRLKKCQVIDRWKEYAYKIIKIQNEKDSEYDYILYNKWLKERKYRLEICEKYNLQFTDDNFSSVSRHGNGSSFTKFKRKTDKEDYLSRYKNYLNNVDYLTLVNDPELIQLSKHLFNFTI